MLNIQNFKEKKHLQKTNVNIQSTSFKNKPVNKLNNFSYKKVYFLIGGDKCMLFV